MNIRHVILFSLAVLSFAYTPSRYTFPTDYFRSPVDGQIKLSGSFGELRSNHFHAGIDIKPKARGRVGDEIYAAADGFVSRISVAPRGYGNGLYVEHPNGYTTVYGHLLKFNDEIAQYIENLHYTNEVFSMDIDTLKATKFPVKKGQVIAYMGNTGSSGGAHLHFEIRNTKTGHAINPLLFGLKVSDNIAPKLNEIKVYHLNHKHETVSAKKYKIKGGSGNYSVAGNEIKVQANRIGLGLKTFDFMTGVPNWNGPFNIKMYQDDSLIYHFEVAELSFDEWYYLNAHVDYREFTKNKAYFNRCFLLPGNGNTTIYKQAYNQGVIELREGQRTTIKFVASDISGNESEVSFTLKKEGTATPNDGGSFNYIFPYKEKNAIRQSEIELYFEEGSFYEDVYMLYAYSMERSDHIYSGVHHIHDKYIPIHKPFTMKIKPVRPIPDAFKDKATIVRCRGADREDGISSEWEGDFLVAHSRSFGDYCIMVDTLAPTIKPLTFKSNMGGYDKMTFKVKDNLTGVKSYNAYVDDEWILLTYDLKTRTLTHKFDGRISRGNHVLKLVVTDGKDNEKVLKLEFVR